MATEGTWLRMHNSAAPICWYEPREVITIVPLSLSHFLSGMMRRSCTCPMRINIAGSPVDHHRSKKA